MNTHNEVTVVMHEPGNCPDPIYGGDCDGIGRWEENPYLAEIYGDYTREWICDGVSYGASMDI